MLGSGVVDAKGRERLRAMGIDIDAFAKCLEQHCKTAGTIGRR
jgi:hypothetical protein